MCSEPFSSHPRGYKITITVFPNGTFPCVHVDAYVLLGVRIERGDFDDLLQWPFKGTVTVQAYNYTLQNWSNEKTIEVCEPADVRRCLNCPQYYYANGRRSSTPGFLSLSQFKVYYMKNNAARFRVTKVEMI